MPDTTSTYAFAPALSDVIIAAYGRCQIRRDAISVEHLVDAAMAANLLQVDWSNDQVNLWTVELISQPLTPFVATYDVDPGTVMIMATYITTETDTTKKDRILTSIDRDTYASYPNKMQPGRPTVYWFNHQIFPTITLWQPPDGAEPYVLNYYRARQIQDAAIPGGISPEVPYRFIEAYVAGLADKVSMTYAPQRTAELRAYAQICFDKAKRRDVENAPLKIVPALSAYTDAVY
jgi:hypothetical protein